jgi:hypothetical protein
VAGSKRPLEVTREDTRRQRGRISFPLGSHLRPGNAGSGRSGGERPGHHLHSRRPRAERRPVPSLRVAATRNGYTRVPAGVRASPPRRRVTQVARIHGWSTLPFPLGVCTARICVQLADGRHRPRLALSLGLDTSVSAVTPQADSSSRLEKGLDSLSVCSLAEPSPDRACRRHRSGAPARLSGRGGQGAWWPWPCSWAGEYWATGRGLADDIATQCAFLHWRAGTSSGRCSSLPIFVSGSDMAEAMEHDPRRTRPSRLPAVAAAQPRTIEHQAGQHQAGRRIANYRRAGARRPSFRRVTSTRSSGPSRAGRGPTCAGPSQSSAWSSVSTTAFRGLTTANSISACSMKTGTPDPTEQMNSTGGDAFLSIPLPPEWERPTLWLCNGKSE